MGASLVYVSAFFYSEFGIVVEAQVMGMYIPMFEFLR